MTDSFAAPGRMMRVHWHELNGTLVAIQPLAMERRIINSAGKPQWSTPANIYIVDGPKAGETICNTLIFPPGIRRAVRGHVGELVLGRVRQGTVPPGTGMLPPWTLVDATNNPDDVAAAAALLNVHSHN